MRVQGLLLYDDELYSRAMVNTHHGKARYRHPCPLQDFDIYLSNKNGELTRVPTCRKAQFCSRSMLPVGRPTKDFVTPAELLTTHFSTTSHSAPF
jgi:hypothetical protein